jgi:hypothetical protein
MISLERAGCNVLKDHGEMFLVEQYHFCRRESKNKEGLI